MLSVNGTVELRLTSTGFSVAYFESKTDRKSNRLLYTESVAVYKHHVQVIVESAQKNGIKKFSKHFSTNLISLQTSEIF
jgi:hypothetical protein